MSLAHWWESCPHFEWRWYTHLWRISTIRYSSLWRLDINFCFSRNVSKFIFLFIKCRGCDTNTLSWNMQLQRVNLHSHFCSSCSKTGLPLYSTQPYWSPEIHPCDVTSYFQLWVHKWSAHHDYACSAVTPTYQNCCCGVQHGGQFGH